MLNNTSTSIGKRKLKDTLLNPIINPTELESRYDLIEMFSSNNPETNEPYYKSFETYLNKIMDIERLHRKISLGLLQPADFRRQLIPFLCVFSCLSKFKAMRLMSARFSAAYPLFV